MTNYFFKELVLKVKPQCSLCACARVRTKGVRNYAQFRYAMQFNRIAASSHVIHRTGFKKFRIGKSVLEALRTASQDRRPTAQFCQYRPAG